MDAGKRPARAAGTAGGMVPRTPRTGEPGTIPVWSWAATSSRASSAEAIDEVPEPFASALDEVAVVVEEHSPRRRPLYGLYKGVPLPEGAAALGHAAGAHRDLHAPAARPLPHRGPDRRAGAHHRAARAGPPPGLRRGRAGGPGVWLRAAGTPCSTPSASRRSVGRVLSRPDAPRAGRGAARRGRHGPEPPPHGAVALRGAGRGPRGARSARPTPARSPAPARRCPPRGSPRRPAGSSGRRSSSPAACCGRGPGRRRARTATPWPRPIENLLLAAHGARPRRHVAHRRDGRRARGARGARPGAARRGGRVRLPGPARRAAARPRPRGRPRGRRCTVWRGW